MITWQILLEIMEAAEKQLDKLQLWAVPIVELRKVNELYTISCKNSSSLNKEELPRIHLFVLARDLWFINRPSPYPLSIVFTH